MFWKTILLESRSGFAGMSGSSAWIRHSIDRKFEEAQIKGVKAVKLCGIYLFGRKIMLKKKVTYGK